MYAPTPPHDEGMLDVGDGQLLHYEVRGNPGGKPAVALHGGPGSGASPWYATFLDPQAYRIVLFDQRGAGRSTPSTRDPATDLSLNTTTHLVADIERLREHLGVDRWLVLGCSWGSTLGLTYAIAHPDRVTEMVLFAVTTTRRRDVEWLTRGVGRFFPEAHERFLAALPDGERDDEPAGAFARLLASPEAETRAEAARAWCDWEQAIAALADDEPPNPRYADPDFCFGFARTVTHYFAHAGFQDDDAIAFRLDRIARIPAVLVHGRLDLAGPADTAWRIAQAWPAAELHVVGGVGHAGSDAMDAVVVAATDRFARTPG